MNIVKNRWQVSFLMLVVAAVAYALFSFAHLSGAANTYSVDFEQSSSQYLSIADASQTGLDLSGPFTFEAWVNLEQLPSTGGALMLINKITSATGGYRWFLDAGTFENKMTVMYWDGSDNYTRVHSTNAIVDSNDIGQWVHLAVTVDPSTQSVSMYKNGSSVGVTANVSNATALGTNSENFSIGAVNTDTTPTWFFDGLIDEVRVWSAVRTGTEISDDKSRELNGNESGLVGYWKLNNGLTDTTANGNTLTNSGSATFATSTPFSSSAQSLKARKTQNESVANATVLQNDDEMVLQLAANTTYVVDGVIFASSTSATPDIGFAFFGPTGIDIAIGYTNDVNEAVLTSGELSNRVQLPANTPTSIHIKGTVKTGGTAGALQLKWAQWALSSSATTVMKGSYIRAESL